MTLETNFELTSAHRLDQTITLTYTRLDGSTSTMTTTAPLSFSLDAKVRNPVRLLTIFPEKQLPTRFWLAADRLAQVVEVLSAPLPPEPLYGDCNHCGAPGAVLYYLVPTISEYLCADCARDEALAVAAHSQLELLVEQSVRAWRHIWPGESLQGLSSRLNQIGSTLEEKLEQEASYTPNRR